MAGPRFLGFGGDNGEDMEKAVKACALSAIYSQPLTVCRTLVQFGYSPLPLYTPFGPRYPFSRGFFFYVFHVGSAYGITSLWAGLEIAVVRATISAAIRQFLFRSLEDYMPNLGGAAEVVKNSPRTIWQRCRLCFRVILRSLLIIVPLNICVYPLQLILNRKIAQVVIGDVGYGGIFDCVSLIYDRDGLKGFFTGFHPFLLSSLLEVFITNSVMLGIDVFFYHFLKNYSRYDEHNILRDLGGNVLKILTSFITYPYALVSTICSIANCGTAARNFKWGFKSSRCADWIELKNTLHRSNVQFRGRSLFLRPYKGPVTLGLDGCLYEAHI